MDYKVVEIPGRKLIGYSIEMSLVENKTNEIWKKFMPRLKEITNAKSADLYSLQVYPNNYYLEFSPFTTFTKWAAIEVKDFENIPENFEQFKLPTGKYAVFLHKGNTEQFVQTAQYIYEEWLPNSGFELDNRPHFELLGDNYLGHENPDSEEEIWVPIK